MRAEIIRIGNSKGLRIPKVVLEQCGIKSAVDLRVKDHSLIVTPYEEVEQDGRNVFSLWLKIRMTPF